MINIEKDNKYVYIYDDGKLLKACEYNELKTKSDIDDVVDECISQFCIHSRGDLVMEHHAKRVYLKMELCKLMGIK